ncbi:MAG: hypothetical protein DDT32_02013 [Syntrophomonadaceae bacterium]|nr:hypothetical protein [Bacillota bacterium]
MTTITITIEARIPTNPEYYGRETSDIEAEDLAKGVREIYEAVLPRWFPNAEINICLVPEISSFGNQTHVYVEVEDVETEMEILRAIKRDVEEAEETIWSNFCHNNLQVQPTIDYLLAKMETYQEKEKGGEMKYTKMQIVTGSHARKAKFYLGSQFILERAEEDYDSGIWLIPEEDYAEWYHSFEALYKAIWEAEPLD